MKLGLAKLAAGTTLVAEREGVVVSLGQSELPPDPLAILRDPELRRRAEAAIVDAPAIAGEIDYLIPLASVGRIICVGLNYDDHVSESPYKKSEHPVYFLRVEAGLVAHEGAIVRPLVSEQLDFEGELAVVIGKGGRSIPVEHALDHVAAYSIFNDGSIRDWQFDGGPQWTLGKNFDATAPLGPFLVAADVLPPGGRGLQLETRLNGTTYQSANTDQFIFPVAELIARASVAMALQPGDVIATGTPSGVGGSRRPQVWMKAGDVCEIEIERIGVLRNSIVDQVG